jgi:hypothetical protein
MPRKSPLPSREVRRYLGDLLTSIEGIGPLLKASIAKGPLGRTPDEWSARNGLHDAIAMLLGEADAVRRFVRCGIAGGLREILEEADHAS